MGGFVWGVAQSARRSSKVTVRIALGPTDIASPLQRELGSVGLSASLGHQDLKSFSVRPLRSRRPPHRGASASGSAAPPRPLDA